MSDLVPRSVEPSNRIFGPLFVRIASALEFLSSGFVGTDPHRPTYYNRPRDTEGERMCGAIWLLGTIRTELKRQREKAKSPVVQVVQLESLLERLSDCRTVPYLRFFLVRNEEVAGSIPVSSTNILNNLRVRVSSFRFFCDVGCAISCPCAPLRECV